MTPTPRKPDSFFSFSFPNKKRFELCPQLNNYPQPPALPALDQNHVAHLSEKTCYWTSTRDACLHSRVLPGSGRGTANDQGTICRTTRITLECAGMVLRNFLGVCVTKSRKHVFPRLKRDGVACRCDSDGKVWCTI